jgi:hypothetical protein
MYRTTRRITHHSTETAPLDGDRTTRRRPVTPIRGREGGGAGIRTLGGLHLTRFRGVLLRPLGHATADEDTCHAGVEIRATAAGAVHRRLAAGGEERGEQRRALGLTDPGDYLGAVVQPPVANDVPQ